MKILADASLPLLEVAFPPPFELSLYQNNAEVHELLNEHTILLCRSTLKVNQNLLQPAASLRYVATASSGHDHIDDLYLESQGIELLDAKGCNAKAVADYVITILAFLQTKHGFCGNKAGIIGLGAVGSEVKARLLTAGMHVFCYDPPKSKQEPQFVSCELEAITECDLVCVHANLHEDAPFPSKNLLDASFLNQLKPGAALINAARGGLVNEAALLQTDEHKLLYCTDVYENEPAINSAIVKHALICTPHIAGHSIEAKQRAIGILSEKLHACYQLTSPTNLPFILKKRPLRLAANWQETLLSIYNPDYETQQLKQSTDLTKTFITLRHAHHTRHDFCSYSSNKIDAKISKLLGK